MANASYEILELRAVINPHNTELYIRCGPDNEGGVLVGGWYKTTIPPNVPAIDAMRDAILSHEYLTKWDRGAPDMTDARRPPPPEDFVGALQDRIHPASGRLLAAKPVRELEPQQVSTAIRSGFAAIEPEDLWREIQASGIEGHCEGCGRLVQRGELVRLYADDVVVHEKCPSPRERASA